MRRAAKRFNLFEEVPGGLGAEAIAGGPGRRILEQVGALIVDAGKDLEAFGNLFGLDGLRELPASFSKSPQRIETWIHGRFSARARSSFLPFRGGPVLF